MGGMDSAATPPPPLPAHASVVVVGGGVMGCSTLYHLAKLGAGDAVLLERNRLTSGTTWHSAAQVRLLRSSRNLTNLIRHSIALYQSLEEETGQSVGWANTGSLSIACNPARQTHIARQRALAQLFGARADIISAGEAKERWPLMRADDVLAAVYSADDGRVNPSDLCAALAKGARAAGGKIFENTPVLGIATRGGKVAGVNTARGFVRCDAVAVCAGLWSGALAASGGAGAPLYPCEHFYLLTRPLLPPAPHLPTLSDHDSHLYIRDDCGGLLVGCFEPKGKAIAPQKLGDDFAFGLLPEDWEHFAPMMTNAMARVPALEGAQVKTLINGPESFTPDGVFMLGEAAQTQNLFLGCGMNSVGVATGGGAGAALAAMIARGRAPADLPEADPKRFADVFNSAAALAARAPEVLGRHYEIDFAGRQPASARNLRLPPLHELWRQRRAHFGQFYGWERPLFFNCDGEPPLSFARPAWHKQTGEEAQAASQKAAVFDLSTLGKIAVCGAGAPALLERLCVANVAALQPGRVAYTALLNPRGGIVGDITVFCLRQNAYRLYVGTDAVARCLAHLRKYRQNEEVNFVDETEQWATLALCGEQAPATAAAAGGGAEMMALPFFAFANTRMAGVEVLAARLSYVGEMGWEVSCRAASAPALGKALLAAGAAPAGIYAQSSMRIEKRFVAYGRDIDADTTPAEAGIPVYWQKDFIGKAALQARQDEAEARRIFCLRFEDDNAVAQGNEPVYVGGKVLGQTTSAAYGYRVGASVALALLPVAAMQAAGGKAEVDIAGERYVVIASEKAAFDPTGERLRGAIALP